MTTIARRNLLGTMGLGALSAALPIRVSAADGARRLILDTVHDNPGEGRTKSAFLDPVFLKQYGYTGQVINDFGFLQTAVTFDDYDPRILPHGSTERAWVEARGRRIDRYIADCHAAGIAAYLWTDMIVLPKQVRALFGSEVVDARGKYSFERPRVRELHVAMLREIGRRFPRLDGVVVRTGETYLLDTPHHEGNNPLTVGDGAASAAQAAAAHGTLIRLLREELCDRAGINVVYRTWAFGGIHTDPAVYRAVTDPIAPHPKLYLSIKHTKGDFHRKFDWNPTLGVGRHQQIVEVQCQREYEGKGAHPNYIAAGVIDGFEEYVGRSRPFCLNDLKTDPRFRGIWTWSRGGGWQGPYIPNEFWCALNAGILSAWTASPDTSEPELFDHYLQRIHRVPPTGRRVLREIATLSAHGVLIGRSSLLRTINPTWIRDQYIGGIAPPDVLKRIAAEPWGSLNADFADIVATGTIEPILAEKDEAVRTWRRIEHLGRRTAIPDAATRHFAAVSTTYGRIKYDVIRQGWTIILLGMAGDASGQYDRARMRNAIRQYDALWVEWNALQRDPLCPTLYRPYAFNYPGPPYQRTDGMKASVDRYRSKAE